MSAATQTQLARKLGLSRSTVAAALNPNSPVKLREETRERVLAEAARLNYRPHHYAQILRGGKSGVIGVFHFGGLSQVAAERAWHASRAIRDAGYRILSSDASWAPGGAKAGCEAMLDARVEGVIVAGLNDPESIVELKTLQQAGVPIVTLSGNELKGAPHIRGDARDATARMASHLLALGRRRILLLCYSSPEIRPGSYLWAASERVEGFQAAMKEAGAPIVEKFSPKTSTPQGRIFLSDQSHDPFDPFLAGCEAMKQALAGGPHPDAVICGNDDWAIGAFSACREAGLHVPRQIALTGYDNTAAGAYLEVPLTTIAQPSQLMAERAVSLLLKMMEGKKLPASSRLTRLPCELIIRESCGSKIKAPRP